MKYFYNVELFYDGQGYFGWQKQKEFNTVQGTLETTLQKIAPSDKIRTMGSSRTDTGVHSRANICFIQIEEDLTPDELSQKLNSELPSDIRVMKCERTYRHFKVIYFAQKKQYIYVFKNTKGLKESPYFHNIEEKLDINRMKEAASIFIGEHDFTNFCYKAAKNTEKVREIFKCEIIEDQNIILENDCAGSFALIIEGSGFLKQMVRIIMGSLINIGLGLKEIDDIKDALSTKEFRKTGFIAPGGGLYLNRIDFMRDPFKGLKSKKKKKINEEA